MRTLPLEVAVDGGLIVLLTGPRAGDWPPHDCRAMGCGRVAPRHVLAVVPMTPTDRIRFAHYPRESEATP
jgi:hypothetical protein